MTDSFQRIPPGLSGCVRHAHVCVRMRVHMCVHMRRYARYSFIRLRGKVPSGLSRMIRTGEYRHICRRFLHKIHRKTSGKFVSAVVTPSETASKSRRDFQPGFQERFREKIAVDFQSAPQKTAEKSPEKIARLHVRTHLRIRMHACLRMGKSRRDIRKRESVRILVLLRARSYIHYVRAHVKGSIRPVILPHTSSSRLRRKSRRDLTKETSRRDGERIILIFAS